MSNLNLETLLAPLVGDSPAGEDLEYDLAFTDLQGLSQGEPDRYVMVKDPDEPSRDIERLIPGTPPDARAIHKAALALFERTRDLRVAFRLTYAETRLNGLPGLASGLALIQGLLENYWETLHPLLDADDDNDPFMRINVLNDFSDPAWFLRALKQVPLVEARGVGRFSFRDLDVANGEDVPDEGQQAASLDLIRAACLQQEPELTQARLAACEQIQQAFKAIQAIFNQHTSAAPNFDRPLKVIKQGLSMLQQADTSPAVVVAAATATDSFTAASIAATTATTLVSSDKIASRDDARKQLQRVCDYLEQHEPAHPSALLIRRSIKLLDMNFLDIIAELSPDALDGIHHLAGIRPDD